MNFEEEIREVIDRHSAENTSNTPDFVLAGYITACLRAFDTAVELRETFYGRGPQPAEVQRPPPVSQ